MPLIRSLRRRLALALPVALTTPLLLADAASAGMLSPEHGGSPNADRINTLWWLIFAMALIVFVVVGGALVYATIKFRAGHGRVARQIHGNTRFEISCTVGAAAILVFLTVVTFIMLPGIKDPEKTGDAGLSLASGTLYASTDQPAPPDGKALKIKVDGQQYAWRFQYPGAEKVYAYYQMVVPADTTVVLDITSDDVDHSWWVPKLGGKADAIPGYTNHTWFKARPGTYQGQCAELCGRNHANMLSQVKAVSPDAYKQWYARKASQLQAAKAAQAKARPRYESGS